MMQKTLSKAISFEGNALHTGEAVKVQLVPSGENTGIVFVRTDLENAEVPALVKYVKRIVKPFFRMETLRWVL